MLPDLVALGERVFYQPECFPVRNQAVPWRQNPVIHERENIYSRFGLEALGKLRDLRVLVRKILEKLLKVSCRLRAARPGASYILRVG